MKSIRDLFDHFKKNPQQLLTIFTVLFSTSLLFVFSKNEKNFHHSENTIGNNDDPLTSTFSSQLSSQLLNHFSYFIGAALQFLFEFGKFPSAAAQTTSSSTIVEYPIFEISSVDALGSSLVVNQNKTRAYLVGNGDYCFKNYDVSNPLNPQLINAYGKTTNIAYHCNSVSLHPNEKSLFVTDTDNGGLSIFNITDPKTPTLLGQLSGFNAENGIIFSENQEYGFLMAKGPQPRLMTIQISDPKNPSLLKATTIPWKTNIPSRYNTKIKMTSNLCLKIQ